MGSAHLDSNFRYDMPPGFGRSVAPDLETGYDLHGIDVEFETSPEAVDALMPVWFRPVPKPRISIGYRHMIGMKWMGGRNYRLISIRVRSLCRFDGAEREVPFCLAIWESDYAPVMAGRELMGAPKLVADIPEVPDVGADHGFVCREYEAELIRASASGLTEVPAGEVARANEALRSQPVTVAYWKHVPGPGGTVDADYPVGIRMDTPIVRMWRGRGAFEFMKPSAVEAPYSSHIVARLADLPCLSEVGASSFRAENCTLYRGETRRLDTDPIAPGGRG